MITIYEPRPPKRDVDAPTFWQFKKTRECKHNYVIAKGIMSNGVIMYKQMCSLCGDVPGGAIAYSKLTQEQKNTAIDYIKRDEIRFVYNSRVRSDYVSAYPGGVNISSQKFNDLWWEWYSGYLKSCVWEIKKQSVRRRARGVCEACGIASSTQVHHLTYDNVGREPLFDLVAICTKCHEQLTQWSRER